MQEPKKRGRPSSGKTPVKADKKVEKEGENGEPVAKRGRGRPKKGSSKNKSKVSDKSLKYVNKTCVMVDKKMKILLFSNFTIVIIAWINRKRARQTTR